MLLTSWYPVLSVAVEIATLTRENNKTKIEILKSDVVDKLISCSFCYSWDSHTDTWEQQNKDIDLEIRCCWQVDIPVLSVTVEIATLTRENNKTKIEILKSDVVDKLIKKHEDEEAKEAEKKKEKSWS